MRLNNRLISSLDAFRRNYSFLEVWNKLNVFLRDLSPQNINYYDDEKEQDEKPLYLAISDPSLYRFNDDGELINIKERQKITCFDSLTKDEQQIICGLNNDDKVRVAAITRLAQTAITDDILKQITTTSSLFEQNNDKEIILDVWQSIPLSQITNNNFEKKLRSVFVSVKGKDKENPFNESYAKVGDIKLKPGEKTIGVFCGNRLIAACPHKAENRKYRLVFEEIDNCIGLKVYDRSSGKVETIFPNARFFTMIGDNNFAVVEEGLVNTYQNVNLDKKIRTKVNILKKPIMVNVKDDILIITYENGSEELIDI